MCLLAFLPGFSIYLAPSSGRGCKISLSTRTTPLNHLVYPSLSPGVFRPGVYPRCRLLCFSAGGRGSGGIPSKYLRAYKAPKKSQYCLAPKFIWGSIKKQNLAQTGFSLLVSPQSCAGGALFLLYFSIGQPPWASIVSSIYFIIGMLLSRLLRVPFKSLGKVFNNNIDILCRVRHVPAGQPASSSLKIM